MMLLLLLLLLQQCSAFISVRADAVTSVIGSSLA
jgi:hypothetical protein